MLATLIAKPFADPGWIFETKWDGFRVVARISDGKATLYSRNGNIVDGRFPTILTALTGIGHDAVLDGELAAFDSKGVTRFQLLQNAERSSAALRYCVFDLMFLDGRDLRRLPLIERKELLRAILPKNPAIVYSAHELEDGIALFRRAEKSGLEGIVAKRAASPYRSGVRSRDWLKIKTGLRQEVAVVGFTEPRGSRTHFGSLVLAVREGDAWRYVGHAGTGFDRQSLADLHARLKPLATSRKPFADKVPNETTTTWVRPELVAEVRFTEWTSGGQMRHPVFLGLRDDKRPEEAVRETN